MNGIGSIIQASVVIDELNLKLLKLSTLSAMSIAACNSEDYISDEFTIILDGESCGVTVSDVVIKDGAIAAVYLYVDVSDYPATFDRENGYVKVAYPTLPDMRVVGQQLMLAGDQPVDLTTVL